MIRRARYLKKMIQYRDNEFVKVMTGVRRSGKSSLLSLFKDYLLEQGVSNECILEINYEKYMFDDIKDSKKMDEYIKRKIVNGSRMYFLVDEVQELENQEDS